MKSTRRSERRWKTWKKRNSRVNKFAEDTLFRWGHGTFEERRQYIRNEQHVFIENPACCSCGMCSEKNSWTHRSNLRRMRAEVLRDVREYEQERDEEDVA